MPSIKVLYIEDDVQQVKLISMFLAREPIQLIAAHDGQNGVEMALQEQPAMILVDINLPVMSGFEVVQTLRQSPQFAATPIIALTSTLRSTLTASAFDGLFDAYLEKPVMRTDLIRCINGFMTEIERKH